MTAARHAVPDLRSREEGLAGREALPRLRLYASTEAHSSIEKAAIVAGIGRAGVRRIPVDDVYRMRPDALEQAVAEASHRSPIASRCLAWLARTLRSSCRAESFKAMVRRDRFFLG